MEEDKLTEKELGKWIRGQWAGRIIDYQDTVDSTNERAKTLASSGCPHGTLVTADAQEAGKGRRGRVWKSPKGTAVYMSLVLRPDLPPSSASMVTLVAALAAAEGVRKVAGTECKIKWPNDLVMGKKKMCGILTEMRAGLDNIQYVIIGTGINTSQDEFPPELSDTATSILLETGRKVNRCQLAAAVMEAFEEYYDRYEQVGNMSLLMEEYNSRLAGIDSPVRVLASEGDYTGISRGIDEEGRLMVETETGEMQAVVSGEISVRGLYGYV